MSRARKGLLGALLLVLGFTLALYSPHPGAAAPPARLASAVFAGGCFWCTEADFDKIPGVVSTTSGYSGGKVANPTYEQVSAGGTGHIESVRVVYDPAKVSYQTLVARFFRTVDPIDGGGQFCDRGYQYRTAIFVADAAQRRVAEATKARAAALLKKPVATLILPAARFYPAEGYHQDYYKKNPVRYKYYRWRCGREARLTQIWGNSAGH
ncbi:MAG TPA: peptide-methionine (S)-S-oxide reductase MsrA [Allosphingosinicella sp.]|jgi:peptide-methionine (S)-S-oxide reductase|nr:peptide-methionine (S)-S-oxide reductase MsrA [Allosphingosinicella sp.]